MTVKQVSVFIENKPGKLAELTEILNRNNIDMRALSMSEAQKFGIVRLIVDDPAQASSLLKEEGYIHEITPVLAAEMPDKPGSLDKILDILGSADINLEYTYAFISRKQDTAYMIMRVDKYEKAIEELTAQGVKLACQHDLSNL